MSDERKPGDGAREPEIVDDDQAPRPGSIRRIEPTPVAPASLGTVLSEMFRSPKRDERKSREWADAAGAESGLDEALTNLSRSRAKLRSVGKLIARDEEQRDLDLMRLKNQRAEEERIATDRALQDELAKEELRAQIAEARRRRQAAENPAPPPAPRPQTERYYNDAEAAFEKHFGKEAAIRAVGQRKIAELLKGDMTPDIELQIKNINDWIQRQIDDL